MGFLMSLIDVPKFTVQEAAQRGQDVFEVLFESWGAPDLVTPSYRNLTYPQPGQPGVPISLAGIALGPRSTVDRAWVTFNLQKPPSVLTGEATASDRVRRLSLGTPLYFTQAGKTGTAPYGSTPLVPNNAVKQQFGEGLLYVYSSNRFLSPPDAAMAIDGTIRETTILCSTYIDAVTGAAVSLGNVDLVGYETPFLHLYLYLKAPIVPVPAKRFPMQRRGAPILVAGAATHIASLPIYGRKHVRIVSHSLQPMTLRAGLLRNMAPAGLVVESDRKTTTALAGIPSEIVYTDPCADYLVLSATVTGADAAAGYSVTAYD